MIEVSSCYPWTCQWIQAFDINFFGYPTRTLACILINYMCIYVHIYTCIYIYIHIFVTYIYIYILKYITYIYIYKNLGTENAVFSYLISVMNKLPVKNSCVETSGTTPMKQTHLFWPVLLSSWPFWMSIFLHQLLILHEHTFIQVM